MRIHEYASRHSNLLSRGIKNAAYAGALLAVLGCYEPKEENQKPVNPTIEKIQSTFSDPQTAIAASLAKELISSKEYMPDKANSLDQLCIDVLQRNTLAMSQRLDSAYDRIDSTVITDSWRYNGRADTAYIEINGKSAQLLYDSSAIKCGIHVQDKNLLNSISKALGSDARYVENFFSQFEVPQNLRILLRPDNHLREFRSGEFTLIVGKDRDNYYTITSDPVSFVWGLNSGAYRTELFHLWLEDSLPGSQIRDPFSRGLLLDNPEFLKPKILEHKKYFDMLENSEFTHSKVMQNQFAEYLRALFNQTGYFYPFRWIGKTIDTDFEKWIKESDKQTTAVLDNEHIKTGLQKSLKEYMQDHEEIDSLTKAIGWKDWLILHHISNEMNLNELDEAQLSSLDSTISHTINARKKLDKRKVELTYAYPLPMAAQEAAAESEFRADKVWKLWGYVLGEDFTLFSEDDEIRASTCLPYLLYQKAQRMSKGDQTPEDVALSYLASLDSKKIKTLINN